MRTKDFLLQKIEKKNIKSKVKFHGNFEQELQKTVDILWAFLDENLEKLYEIDYVDVSRRNIKIKVNDENKFIFRTVQCTFDETVVDGQYGNSRIELTFTEISQKPRYALVWKYNILDREKINHDVVKYVIKWLEEIYE